MPDNRTIIEAIDGAGLANASAIGEVVKEIDLGELADALKGQALKVCVNPAAYITPVLWQAMDEITREQMLAALRVMTGIPVEAWARWSDAFVAGVFARARTLFFEHDQELRKNSPTR